MLLRDAQLEGTVPTQTVFKQKVRQAYAKPQQDWDVPKRMFARESVFNYVRQNERRAVIDHPAVVVRGLLSPPGSPRN